METAIAVCEVWFETEETVDDLNRMVGLDQLWMY